jgi:hypothetical protein
MHSVWSFETIVLLPQEPKHSILHDTLNIEAQTPFLSIKSRTLGKEKLSETQMWDPISQMGLWHLHPHILNLGLLLVLLGTKGGSPNKPLETINSKWCFCKSQLRNKENWPYFDSSEQVKEEYRKVVQHCIPEGGKKMICNSLAERRQMLLENVSRPFYNLLQTMQDPIEDEPLSDSDGGFQDNRNRSEGMDNTQETLW